MTKEEWNVLRAGLAAGMRPSLKQIRALAYAYERAIEHVCPVPLGEPQAAPTQIDWVRIPAGSVTTDQGNTISIANDFEMARTPVTQAQWHAVMGTNPSKWKGDDLPVESVSWYDAVAFCEKIGARLPNELEWEYACRAGTSGDRYGELDEIAWYCGNSDGQPHSVANKKPNAFGLYDMLGNVWEWTSTQEGSGRVDRGGSWDLDAGYARAPDRFNRVPGIRDYFLGFRPVRDCRGDR